MLWVDVDWLVAGLCIGLRSGGSSLVEVLSVLHHTHHISMFVDSVHCTVMIGECDAVMICCELMLNLLQACVLDGIEVRRVAGCAHHWPVVAHTPHFDVRFMEFTSHIVVSCKTSMFLVFDVFEPQDDEWIHCTCTDQPAVGSCSETKQPSHTEWDIIVSRDSQIKLQDFNIKPDRNPHNSGSVSKEVKILECKSPPCVTYFLTAILVLFRLQHQNKT